MKEIESIDHLKALPISVVIRTKSGRTLERNEVGTWSEMGKGKSLVNFDEEADFPATVIWSYAEQIGDATVEALAELATAMLTANFRQQQMAQQQAAEQQAEQQRLQQEAQRLAQQQAGIEQTFVQNGQPAPEATGQVVTPEV